MGQQAGALLTPCVVRGKPGAPKSREDFVACLRRVEGLITVPEKLEAECEFHFRRAGLDAHGTLRRVELRRLLWTFAHSLGSTELTWEAIEASAVAGTVEPHVPVVTSAEFFRCVLKTVHLVSAELRRKVAEADAHQQQLRAATPAAGAGPATQGSPRTATAGQQSGASEGSASSSRSSSPGPPSADPPEEAEPEAPPSGKGSGKGRPPPRAREPPEAPMPAEGLAGLQGTSALPFFRPAPGGSPDEEAPVNGMTAMVLSNEGTFDKRRLFVGHGVLVLNEPSEAAPSLAQRLLGGSDESMAFDLSQLEYAASGEDIARTPLAMLLRGVLGPEEEELECILAMGFAGDEVLCLQFATPKDCDLCRRAVTTEGVGA